MKTIQYSLAVIASTIVVCGIAFFAYMKIKVAEFEKDIEEWAYIHKQQEEDNAVLMQLFRMREYQLDDFEELPNDYVGGNYGLYVRYIDGKSQTYFLMHGYTFLFDETGRFTELIPHYEVGPEMYLDLD